MPARELSFTDIRLTFIAILQRFVGPFITLLMLIFLVQMSGNPWTEKYTSLGVIAILLYVIIYRDFGNTYTLGGASARVQAISYFVYWIWFTLTLLLIGYITGYIYAYPLEIIAAWVSITPFLIIIAHKAIILQLRSSLRTERNKRTVIIVGINDQSKNLAWNINNCFYLGMSFKGFFEDRAAERVDHTNAYNLLGRLNDAPSYIRKNKINIVYIALPIMQEQRILHLLDELKDTTTSIYYVPDFFVHDLIQSRVDYINGTPALSLCETPFYGVNGLIKRINDIVIACIALILSSPLLLLIAVILKITSPGPVIFKQTRYGLNGEEIEVYKFRTMTTLENKTITQVTKDDPRVTRFGRLLRKTSVDELPQFFNVLQGEMSVVGPRPHAVEHNEIYRKLIKGYMVRHKVKPGITGWAQVNGLRGETDTIDKMEARINLDLDYLRNWSNTLDIKILLKTLWVVLNAKNAL